MTAKTQAMAEFAGRFNLRSCRYHWPASTHLPHSQFHLRELPQHPNWAPSFPQRQLQEPPGTAFATVSLGDPPSATGDAPLLCGNPLLHWLWLFGRHLQWRWLCGLNDHVHLVHTVLVPLLLCKSIGWPLFRWRVWVKRLELHPERRDLVSDRFSRLLQHSLRFACVLCGKEEDCGLGFGADEIHHARIVRLELFLQQQQLFLFNLLVDGSSPALFLALLKFKLLPPHLQACHLCLGEFLLDSLMRLVVELRALPVLLRLQALLRCMQMPHEFSKHVSAPLVRFGPALVEKFPSLFPILVSLSLFAIVPH